MRSHRLSANVRVDDLQPAAAHEDRAATAAVASVSPVALPSTKRIRLHDEPRLGLVVAVRRRPDLRPVAGVHVEDAALALRRSA